MYELAKGEVVAWRIVLQVVISFAFLGFAVVLGIYVFPHLKRLLNKIPEKKNANIQPRDEVHLFLMLAWLVLLGWLAYIPIGSHLLGALPPACASSTSGARSRSGSRSSSGCSRGGSISSSPPPSASQSRSRR